MTIDPKYTVRVNIEQYQIINTAYELRRSELIQEGSKAQSMNSWLLEQILDSLEQKYGD